MPLSGSNNENFTKLWDWATQFTGGVSAINRSDHDLFDNDVATAIDEIAGRINAVEQNTGLGDASESAKGVAEFATAAEFRTGTDATRTLRPSVFATNNLPTYNHRAAADPDADDDGAGTGGNGVFLPGALWTNTSSNAVFVCVSNATGAADWDQINGSGGLADVVSDLTPQLGGQLDVNGQAIGDGTLELITFTEDASAVNHLNVENEATGSGPTLSSTGDDTNVDLNLSTKGTGAINLNASAAFSGNASFGSGAVLDFNSSDVTLTHSAGALSLAGTLLIDGDVQHVGDTDTKLAFGTDTIGLETGGSSRLDISNSGVRLGGANARVTTVLDQDDMSSDSATALSTQQAIKAYVDRLGLTTTGNGAALVGVEDSGGNFTGNNVEAVLAELADGAGLSVTETTPITAGSGTSHVIAGSLDGSAINVIQVRIESTQAFNASANIQLRIGDSGGIESTGYVGQTTTGFLFGGHSDGDLYSGILTLVRVNSSGSDWVCSGSLANVSDGNTVAVGGFKSLSGELTQVSINSTAGNFSGTNSLSLMYY